MIVIPPTIRPLTPFPAPGNNVLATSETTPPDSYVPANGLVAWWRGDVVDYDPVTVWHDFSGNGHDLVLTYGTGPESAPTWDNGGAFPVVRWDGTQNPLDLSEAGENSELYEGANPRSVVVVFQGDDLATLYAIIGQTEFSVPSFKIVQNLDKVGVYGVDTILEEPTVIDTGYRWAIATYDGTDTKIFTKDGDATLTEVLNSGGPFFIGGDIGAPTPFQGSVAEALVYDHALTTEEQAALVNYLEDKFSL